MKLLTKKIDISDDIGEQNKAKKKKWGFKREKNANRANKSKLKSKSKRIDGCEFDTIFQQNT